MYELELSNNFSVLNQQNSHMSSPDNTTLNPILTSSFISDIKAHVSPPASNTHPNSSKTSCHNCTNSKSSSHSGYDIPTKGKNWRAMIVNVNGLRSKVPQLNTVVNYVKPDVIVGCESKILAVTSPAPKCSHQVIRKMYYAKTVQTEVEECFSHSKRAM